MLPWLNLMRTTSRWSGRHSLRRLTPTLPILDLRSAQRFALREATFTSDLNVTLAELDEDDQSLVGKALAASANAYAPYSGFAVGAAVRTKGGNVYVRSECYPG